MTLGSKLCLTQYQQSALDQYLYLCKKRYKYFKSGKIYVQNWQILEPLKYILVIQKTPNESIVSNYKSDRP